MTGQQPVRARRWWIIGVLGGAGLFFAAFTASIAYAGDPPTPYEEARQTRDAITRGDYATARRIAASVLAESKLQRWNFYPFTDFMDAISDVYNPVFGAHIAEWLAHDPSDPIVLLISAQYKSTRGWFIRGTDWASRTETDRRFSFNSYLTEALGDVDQSIRRDNKNPYAFYLKLDIMGGFGLHKDVNPQFKDAIARFPTYVSLYRSVLGTAEPRWGGSITLMYAFVDQYAGGAPNNSPLKLLYLQLYSSLLDDAATACANLPGDREAKRQCVATAMQQLVRPGLRKQIEALFGQYNADDQSEFDAAVGPILSQMAELPYADIDVGKLLAMAGDAMHSDTRLDPSNLGHHNYALDSALSSYWQTIGAMDYALTKAQHALLDIENTRFPSALEKKTALVTIHEQMARLYTLLGRRTDAIEAEKSALSLGVRTYWSELLCSNTYGLKDYARAIEICSEIIAGHPANMESRFWRGQAYLFSNQTDKGDIDLKAVAESSSPRRVAAAMSIAMTRLSKQNFRGAVEAFDKYPYLFDPRLTSNAEVAMTYYNRCFANWRLGALETALDDCNQSIKLGRTSGAEYMLGEIKRKLAAK